MAGFLLVAWLVSRGDCLTSSVVGDADAHHRFWERRATLHPAVQRRRSYDGGLLELAFSTKALRMLCESEAAATQKLGAERAESLKRRVADLRAAHHAGEVVAGRPRQAADSRDHLEIDISAGSSVVLSSNHATTPRLDSGGVDWSNVTRVKVLRIETDNG